MGVARPVQLSGDFLGALHKMSINRPTIASMMAGPVPRKTLRDGTTVPTLGLGTYMAGGEPVSWALETGYRLIDTATLYK